MLDDTERDGHLVVFNRMFAELGVPVRWSPAEYRRRLAIGGGKERLRSLLTSRAGALVTMKIGGTSGRIWALVPR